MLPLVPFNAPKFCPIGVTTADYDMKKVLWSIIIEFLLLLFVFYYLLGSFDAVIEILLEAVWMLLFPIIILK